MWLQEGTKGWEEWVELEAKEEKRNGVWRESMEEGGSQIMKDRGQDEGVVCDDRRPKREEGGVRLGRRKTKESR